MKKSAKVYTAFLNFTGHTFSKENIEDRVKLLGSNVLNCYLEITTANLRKIGLKMNQVSKNLAPPRAGPCPSLHQESAPPGHSFTLPAMNGPLHAELKHCLLRQTLES